MFRRAPSFCKALIKKDLDTPAPQCSNFPDMKERVLGLDIGHKRIGVAVSDELGLLAHPLETLESFGYKKDLQSILEIAEIEQCEKIVIGLPIRTDGTEGPEAKKVKRLARRIQEEAPFVTVILWDERYSTVEADEMLLNLPGRARKRRKKIDRSAAAVILGRYLEESRAEDDPGGN